MNFEEKKQDICELLELAQKDCDTILFENVESELLWFAKEDNWAVRDIIPLLLGTTERTITYAVDYVCKHEESGVFIGLFNNKIERNCKENVMSFLESGFDKALVFYFALWKISKDVECSIKGAIIRGELIGFKSNSGEFNISARTFLLWAIKNGYIPPKEFEHIYTPTGGSTKETPKIKETVKHCEIIVKNGYSGMLDANNKISRDIFRELVQDSMAAHGKIKDYQKSACDGFYRDNVPKDNKLGRGTSLKPKS